MAYTSTNQVMGLVIFAMFWHSDVIGVNGNHIIAILVTMNFHQRWFKGSVG
jgi:hypothetical protein